LQNIRLGATNLTNAIFTGARLDAVTLAGAHLKSVHFFSSHIRNA
jgi:uncharacterized protein YjbI with pentapeptide repeats